MSTAGSSGSETCPLCGERMDRGEGDFCPGCGAYVPPAPAPTEASGAGETEPAIRVRQPGETAAPPKPTPHERPELADTASSATDLVCRACSSANPPGRRLCRRCGAALTAAGERGPIVVADEAPARRDRRPLWLGGGVAAALVAVVAFLALRGPGEVSTGASAGPEDSTPPPVAEPTPLDRSLVSASATSTLAEQALANGTVISYDATQTLDGDPTTAWTHGNPGAGVGEALTYTFAEPVTLTGLSISNGYQRSEETFRRNSRIQTAEITTDAGSVQVTLEDARGRQQVLGDFGTTTSLRIEVLSVYPGEVFEGKQAFDDLAVSEIDFLVLPGT